MDIKVFLDIFFHVITKMPAKLVTFPTESTAFLCLVPFNKSHHVNYVTFKNHRLGILIVTSGFCPNSLTRHFTRKLWPAGGARGKVRRSLK